MKGLSTLIRLNRWRVDEKRRELRGLEDMRSDLVIRRTTIDVEMATEQSVGDEPVVQFSYGAFVRAALLRRETLTRSIAEVEHAVEEKQSELADCVRELKKIEVAAERRAERERLELSRREQIEVDEISMNVFRRQG
ncbi:flagellar FliJ family protein [Govanella unica]|uniref:Flagellar FliJ protein n=1 Tax=Govanella unica TaxID=2975056 RepID=A0A9X3Z6K0_9PROT|nr:flagellar FliJ family protein [Govania unica]MDA5193172.1 flagellar FliJ family protein [Govania unica]